MVVSMVEWQKCHGLHKCMHMGEVQMVRDVQHGALDHARGHLGCFAGQWWGLAINGALDPILG